MACTVTPEGPAPPARAGLPGRRLGGVLPPRVGPKGVQVWKAVWSEGSALRGPVGWGGGALRVGTGVTLPHALPSPRGS